jgi:hypothetical protein
MDAAAELTRALHDWGRLTDLENQAILNDNWPGLAELQARKAELQPAIEHALGILRTAAASNVQCRFGAAFGELTALEKRNADLLAARRERCRAETQRAAGSLRDLQGVRRVYGSADRPFWHTYS